MADQQNYAVMDEEEMSELLQRNPKEVLSSHNGREYVSTHFSNLAQRRGMSPIAFEDFLISQGMELIDAIERHGIAFAP